MIGTGTMGRPIAINYLAAGQSAIVYNAHALERMHCGPSVLKWQIQSARYAAVMLSSQVCPSSAWRMVDDSEGKAIGSGDCHMTPVRESTVSGPIHRPQCIDPVLCSIFRFLQAILPGYCLLTSSPS
jgi:hypothetical protein